MRSQEVVKITQKPPEAIHDISTETEYIVKWSQVECERMMITYHEIISW
jgi:hypothetical protein